VNEFASFLGKNAAVGKQLLWEHTIHQVAVLFHEAEQRIRSADGQARYPNIDGWWRQTAHKINGKAGYQVPEETAVSEAFIEEMENAKRDMILDASLDPDLANIDLLEFAAEVPRRQKKGIGRKSKPTDFRFYRSGLGDIELRIEAKVVVDTGDISKHYLSSKGLGRFSDPDEPYTDELIGGMVAYTVTDDRSTWQARINAGMTSASIASFHYALPQNGQRLLFSQVPYMHVKTPVQTEVLVFHLVLELDCAPSAR
jgi:hypothetical protein